MMKKKSKKQEVTHIEEESHNNQKNPVDIEVQDLDDIMDDLMIKQLSQVHIKKKPITQKSKEKKVLEFKSRVLELIEIFADHTTSPGLLINKMFNICQTIQPILNDHSKTHYIQRLCNVVIKMLKKNDTFEVMENYEQMLSILSICLNKAPKQLIGKLENIYELTAKVISKLETQQSRAVIIKQLKQLINLFTTKHNSNLRLDFLKKMIRDNFQAAFICYKHLMNILQFNEESKCKTRKRIEVASLVLFICKSNLTSKFLVSEKNHDESKKIFQETFRNVCDNVANLKFQPIATIKRLYEAGRIFPDKEFYSSIETTDLNLKKLLVQQ